jgi:hypothetical protein
MKIILASTSGAALFLSAVFGLNYFGYINIAFFAPKYEDIRRSVMINSRSYDEGAQRELYRLKSQYQQAKTDEEKAILAASAKHEFSIYPKDRLPPDLLTFLSQIEGN